MTASGGEQRQDSSATLRDWAARTSPVPEYELSFIGPQIKRGSMGAVYEVDAEPACFYKKYEKPEQHVTRLRHLVDWRRKLDEQDLRTIDRRCAWPIVTVVDERNDIVGFLMHPAPKEFWARDSQDRIYLLELSHLLFPDKAARLGSPVPDRDQRLELLWQLTMVFDTLGRHDLVYGDFSEHNVLWTLTPDPRIFLIDCDNARPEGLPGQHAGVAKPRSLVWRDPALPKDGLHFPDIRSDRYALAMFCYRVYYRVDSALSYEGTRPVLKLPDGEPVVPLIRVLPRGLSRDPEARPPASEWKKWLAATRMALLRDASRQQANEKSPRHRSLPSARGPLTARSTLWILAVVIVVAVIAFLVR